ncbi:MAG: MFS transporter [Flavobacteriales bacterium]|nr:MFS transporter [Flavobacteriales bacterium]
MSESLTIQTHSKATFLYSLSKIFERASYYGVRALIVLFMLSETIGMESGDALEVYGWFTGGVFLFRIIGALLGDLLLGNKRAMIIGGIIQALGTFILSFQNELSLYMGLGLIALGGGLYHPNIISRFGKLYYEKKKIIDAGFTIFYTAANLGALIGVVLIGLAYEMKGTYGFILAGIFMVVAVVFSILPKEEVQLIFNKAELSINKRVIHIVMAVVFIALFWGAYEYCMFGQYEILSSFIQNSNLGLTASFWTSSLNSFVAGFVGLIACVVWTYLYINQFVKIVIGLVLSTAAFGILLILPNELNDENVAILIISVFLLGLSEVIISPVVASIITLNSNPKYLAIINSLSFIPFQIISYLIGLMIVFEDTIEFPVKTIGMGVTIFGVVGVGALAFYIFGIRKKKVLMD